ncbi:hypothetical protein DXB94_03950, partial [Butyricicoccus sp. OM06-6AC]
PSADGGSVAAPAGGAKRKDNLRTAGALPRPRRGKKEGQPAVFLPLWTPTFPLSVSLAQIADM